MKLNSHRTRPPTATSGRVGPFGPDTRVIRLGNGLMRELDTPAIFMSSDEQQARISTKPMAHADFDWVAGPRPGSYVLQVKCSSYAHPEFWLEACLPQGGSDCDYMLGEKYMPCEGRTCKGVSEPCVMSVTNGLLKFGDAQNLSFWLEVPIPADFRLQQPRNKLSSV